MPEVRGGGVRLVRGGMMDAPDSPIFGTGRPTVAGLDDIEAGGDAGAEALQFLDYTGDDEDTSDPSAEVPVTLSGGLWQRRRNDGVLVVGQEADKHTHAQVRLPTGDDHNRWLGLALIDIDSRDIRANLLGLVWQHNVRTLPKLIRYGANYLLMVGHDHDRAILEAAAADALLIFTYGVTRGDGTARKRKDGTYTASAQVKRHRPRRPTLRDREDQFGMGHGNYAPVRDAAEAAYWQRYREAVSRFANMDNWRPTQAGRSFEHGFAEPEWLPNTITTMELSGPVAQVYHQHHPAEPATDWMRRGLLIPAKRHTERYGAVARDSNPIARRAA